MCNINQLPREILIHIFSYLDFGSVITAKEVCSLWDDIILDCPTLSKVPLVYDANTNFESLIAKVIRSSETIETLIVSEVQCTKNVCTLLWNQDLERLRMMKCKVDNQTIRNINTLNNLTVLDLKNCYIFDFNLWLCLCFDFSKLSNLKYLRLSDFGLCDENFRGLLKCDKLAYVDIKQISGLSQENVINFIDKNKHILNTLHLYGGEEFNTKVFKHIVECKNLKSLCFTRCDKFTDDCLSLVGKLKLSSLKLSKNDLFTENGFVRLFSTEPFLLSIKYLHFSKLRNMTNKIIRLVGNSCRKLELVNLSKCPKIFATSSPEYIEIIFPSAKIFTIDATTGYRRRLMLPEVEERYGFLV